MIISGVTLKNVTVVDWIDVVPTPTLYLDAVDYSGSGLTWPAETGPDGVVSNGPTYVAASPTYFELDGTASPGKIAYTANLKANFSSSNSQTLEIWVRTAGDNGVIITQQGASPINTGYHLSVMEIVSGSLKVGLWQNPGSIGNVTVGAVTRDEWQQYVLTYDDDTNTLTGYINAATSASTTVENLPPSPEWYYALCQADATSMGDGSGLVADIGLFRVWNTALTAEQVQALYDENVDRFANPVTQYLQVSLTPDSYPGSGTTWTDSISGASATLTGSPTYDSQTGFTFDGTTSQYARMPSVDGETNFSNTAQYSVELWFNPAAGQPSGTLATLFEKWNSTNQSRYPYVFRYGENTSTVNIAAYDGVNGPTASVPGVTTGSWYQLVVVFDFVADTMTPYLNGVAAGSPVSLAALNQVSNTSQVGIAHRIGTTGTAEFMYKGSIGIIRIYSQALSSADVAQNFNADRGRYGL